MAIEINGLPIAQRQQTTDDRGQVTVSRSEPSAPQQETGVPTTTDTVSLTDAASRLRSLENTMTNLPVVDNQRVEEVQRALAEGNYEIDATRIADKMINFERSLNT